MKKFLLLAVMAILLAACGNEGEESKVTFTEKNAVPFEIVNYMEEIAPVYMNQVPHIAYAETEPQFELLKKRFQLNESLQMDMNESIALFVVSQSDSCGIITDGVYNVDGKLSVQLIEPTGDQCDIEPMYHTFLLEVPKSDYEKVQLFNGNVIKSSMDIKPVE